MKTASLSVRSARGLPKRLDWAASVIYLIPFRRALPRKFLGHDALKGAEMLARRIVVALSLTVAACSSATTPRDASPLAADASVAGISQPDLTKRWWQWASSFETSESPVADPTGERCGAGQEGPVWFLAGTYGSAPAHRKCHVPAGKYLFFPLINYVVMPTCAECRNTCDDTRATARAMTDRPMGLFAELDGRSFAGLEAHRVAASGCFNLAERVPGAPEIAPTASDGYWLLLPPLAKGEHALRFGGSLPSLRQELVYTLVVE